MIAFRGGTRRKLGAEASLSCEQLPPAPLSYSIPGTLGYGHFARRLNGVESVSPAEPRKHFLQTPRSVPHCYVRYSTNIKYQLILHASRQSAVLHFKRLRPILRGVSRPAHSLQNGRFALTSPQGFRKRDLIAYRGLPGDEGKLGAEPRPAAC